MTGSADRMWVRVAMKPEATEKKGPRKRIRQKRSLKPRRQLHSRWAQGLSGRIRRCARSGCSARSRCIRIPAKAKSRVMMLPVMLSTWTTGARARRLTYIYQRDPTEDPPRPGPLPLAWVSTEDRLLKGEVIRVNQETDQAWVDGPGTSTQLTARGFLTDKAHDDGTDPAASPGRRTALKSLGES